MIFEPSLKRILKIIILTIITGLSVNHISFSNNENDSDSLLNLINSAKDDTNKVLLIIRLIDSYPQTSSADAIAYSKKCLELSQQLSYMKGELFANEKLGILLKNIGEFDSAMGYTEKAIELAELLGDKKLQAKSLNVYGSMLRRKGYYSSALDYHNKGLFINREINDKQGIANSLLYIATIHEFKLNYDTAIAYYYQCLKTYDELNDRYGRGTTYLNMGDLFMNTKDMIRAKSSYFKGLELFTSLGDIRKIGLSNNKIGTVYSQQKKYDSAYYYYNTSKIYFDSVEDKTSLAHLDVGLGNLFLNSGRPDSAFQYYVKAKNAFQKMNFKEGYLSALFNLANCYAYQGKTQTSLLMYDTCRLIATEVNPKILMNVYQNVLNIYKEAKDYKKAFEYQTKYFEIYDSIFNLDKTKIINDLTLKYEKEKYQARILLLENENLNKSLDLRKRTLERNGYLFAGSGAILILLFIVIFYRHKAKKDKIIAEQKILRLEEEKKLLAAQAIVNGQEEERKRIANELHDGLGVLLSTVKMQFSSIRDISPEIKPVIDKAAKLLEQATGDVRRISHNMMPGLLTKFGFYEAAEDLFDQINLTQGIKAEIYIDGGKTRLQDNIEIMIYRILQEMVNNTLKHANAKNIVLFIKIDTDHLNIKYTDDGQGFDFHEKLNQKTIGLNGILSRVKFLNGTASIDSTPGNGSVFSFHIPIIKN